VIQFDDNTKQSLINVSKEKNLFLEGNILKIIDHNGDEEFSNYILDCIERDKDVRRKRLEITKKIQSQNNELVTWKEDHEKISLELNEEIKRTESAVLKAENAKKIALNDLDLLQKKTQTELMGNIVKVALGVIIFISLTTTGLYILSLMTSKDVDNIGTAWNNMFGILLTNAFSIVGTIMGVKYGSKKDC